MPTPKKKPKPAPASRADPKADSARIPKKYYEARSTEIREALVQL